MTCGAGCIRSLSWYEGYLKSVLVRFGAGGCMDGGLIFVPPIFFLIEELSNPSSTVPYNFESAPFSSLRYFA
jgi:hypothetical protein